MNEQDTSINLDEINIRSVCTELLKNSWILILSAIAAVFFYTAYEEFIYTPQYQSSVTMVVSAKGSGTSGSYASLQTMNEMADVFKNVFQSDVLKKHIESELGEEDIPFTIQAEIIPETNLLTLSVTGERPGEVYKIMKTTLQHYPDVSGEIFSNAVLEVLEGPNVPYESSNEPDHKQVALFVMLAVCLSAGIMILLYVFRGTVKTEKCAKRKVNGKRLALILHEEKNKTFKSKLQKSNKAILLTNPVTSFQYSENFHKLAFRIRHRMDKQQKKILLVTSVSENEGKSTVASNLALSLAKSGKRVSLIDFDLRHPSIARIFDEKIPDHIKSGFCNKTLTFSEGGRLSMVINGRNIKNTLLYFEKNKADSILEEEKKKSDYIIIDSSPMQVAADTEILARYADAVVLVIRQDKASIAEINHSVDILKKTDLEYLGYILNDFYDSKIFTQRQNGYDKKYGYYGYGEK